MTMTPYCGIAVFDVEENGYVFKEKGSYKEGIDISMILSKIGADKVMRAAAHTIKFLNGEELEEMLELISGVPGTEPNSERDFNVQVI